MSKVWYEPTNPKPNHHYSCGSRWTNRRAMSNIKDNLAMSLPKTQARMPMRQCVTHLVLAKICLLSSFLKRLFRMSTTRTRMTRATTSWHASSDHQTSEINGGLSMVSRKAMTTVTRQHPKVVKDEASMQVPMRFFPCQSRRLAYRL